MIAVTGQRLIDGVIHNFIHQMVQTRGGGGADIHTRPLAYGFQTFQNLNLGAAVFLCYFGFVRHKFTPVLQKCFFLRGKNQVIANQPAGWCGDPPDILVIARPHRGRGNPPDQGRSS